MTARASGGSGSTTVTLSSAADLWQGLNTVGYINESFTAATGAGDAETNELHFTAAFDCLGVIVVYHNAYGTAEQTTSIGELTLASAVVSGGTVYEAPFSGAHTAKLRTRGVLKTDPVMIPLAANASFTIRTYVQSDTGWPTGRPSLGSSSDGNNRGIAAADLTHEGDSGPTVLVSPNFTYGIQPVAVLGIPKYPNPYALVSLGDSNMAHASWVESAFLANGLPLINTGIVNGRAVEVASTQGGRYRRLLCRHATDVIVSLLTNDLNSNFSGGNSQTIVAANLQAVWDAAAEGGARVWGNTIPPQTTSTDSWATTVNQTTPAYFNEAARKQINTWIRTTPPPLTGYFELADQVESARDSGKWKPGYTNDGTHFNGTGVTAIVSYINGIRSARFPLSTPATRTVPDPPPVVALPTISSATYVDQWAAWDIASTDGTTIQTWTGHLNAKTLTQATAGLRPTYKTNQAFGRPVVRFSKAAGTYLKATPFTLDQPLAVFIVLKRNTAFTGAFEAAYDGNTNSALSFFQKDATNYTYYTASGALPDIPASDTATVYHLFTTIWNGVSSAARVDGGSAITGTSGTATSAGGFTVGALGDGTNPGNYDIAEVVVVSGAINGTDRAAIEAVMKTNYSIA